MAELWKAAAAIAGIGAVGAFVFWSLFKKWLSLEIFQKLTKRQQYNLFLLFFLLTFVFAMTALLIYAFQPTPQPTSPSSPSDGVLHLIDELEFRAAENRKRIGEVIDGFEANKLVPSSYEFAATEHNTEAIERLRQLNDEFEETFARAIVALRRDQIADARVLLQQVNHLLQEVAEMEFDLCVKQMTTEADSSGKTFATLNTVEVRKKVLSSAVFVFFDYLPQTLSLQLENESPQLAAMFTR